MYVPPKLNTQFRITNEKMVARLKIARTAPEIDTQFFIDDGSFILKFYMVFYNLICSFKKAIINKTALQFLIRIISTEQLID
jgi:hypothetical protein